MSGIEGAAVAACTQAAGASHLLRAAAWDSWGSSSLGLAHSVTHLACYGRVCSRKERCLAWAQLSMQVASMWGHAAAEQVGARFIMMLLSELQEGDLYSGSTDRVVAAVLQGTCRQCLKRELQELS